MASVGSTILRNDYIEIRDKVASILGAGSAQRGYGQPVLSSAFNPSGAPNGTEITRAQWLALRNDIINIKWHQDGIQPTIADIAAGSVIRYGSANPNTNYNDLIEQAIQTRFNVGPVSNRSIITAVDSTSRTGSWSVRSTASLTVTFNNANEARWFFNSGGKIRFLSSRTGGAATQQNGSWTGLLNGIGTVEFGGNVPTFVNFYTLTNQNQFVIQSTPTGAFAYTGNFYAIEARCNVTDNSQGGATQIIFDIVWEDSYEDPGPNGPGDIVDGTLSLAISELKASGPLVQGGLFTVVSPATYSLSAITAS
jgi:hypothetical protein